MQGIFCKLIIDRKPSGYTTSILKLAWSNFLVSIEGKGG